MDVATAIIATYTARMRTMFVTRIEAALGSQRGIRSVARYLRPLHGLSSGSDQDDSTRSTIACARVAPSED